MLHSESANNETVAECQLVESLYITVTLHSSSTPGMAFVCSAARKATAKQSHRILFCKLKKKEMSVVKKKPASAVLI